MTTQELLTIAIDFDDTFTADTKLWRSFITLAQGFGHRVICVTARRESFESRRELERALGDGVVVLFAYDCPKRLYAQQHKVDVDIWCDDMPESIAPDSRLAALQAQIAQLQRRIEEQKDRLEILREQKDCVESRVKAAVQAEMAQLRAQLVSAGKSGGQDKAD